MKVLFMKCRENAVIPKYANPGDAGMDICAAESTVVPSGERRSVGTGLKMQLPSGTEAQIRPRSGLALRHGVTLLNTPGTIDEGYRGELRIIVINHGSDDFVIEPGMRIAQMVIAPVLRVQTGEVAQLTETVRGEGGFGSTGA